MSAFARKSFSGKKDSPPKGDREDGIVGRPRMQWFHLLQPAKHHPDAPHIDVFHKFSGAPLVHKDKRTGSSRFRSARGEVLEKLPLLKGLFECLFMLLMM